MMTKVLITGSNGLLGQKLTDLYLKKENKLLIATGKGENRHPVKSGYRYEEMDIADYVRVKQVLEKHRPDVVIHTAAMTNVDACESDKQTCIELNVHSVENLAKLSAMLNFHLIHLSTDFIFDGTKKMYTETDLPNPLSFYGHSKLQGEEMVQKYATSWAILRTVLVYGVVSDMSRTNIVLWAYNMLKGGKPANVVDDQFRTPTLAEDLAMGCFLVEDQKAQGIFNIAGPDFMNIYELVEKVANHFSLSMDNVGKVKSETLNQPAKRPPITGLDISKANKELGFAPKSFEVGLELLESQFTR